MKRCLNRIFSAMLGAAILTASVPMGTIPAAYAATGEADAGKAEKVTLNPVVIGYEVYNSKGKALDSIYSGTPFKMKITIKDIGVKTSQLGANGGVDFLKSMDSFKGTIESLTILSSGEELLKYDIVLKDCKWTGGDSSFGFMVGYTGVDNYASGSVNVTECTEKDSSDDSNVSVAEPIIKISAVEPSSAIRAGETGEFKIKLKNLGSTAAYNVLAEVTPSNDILIIDGTGTQDIESIDFKEEKILTIKYKALEKIDSEKQNFGVSLKYYYDSGITEVSGSSSAQVAVAAELSTVEKVYPVIDIDFSLAEAELNTDSEYTGEITIKNSGTADMNDVFVTLEASDDIIVTGGTGRRYFEAIPINSSKTLTVKFRTMEEFSALRQSLKAAVKYTYVYGNEEPDGSYEQSFVLFGEKQEEAAPLPVISSTPLDSPLIAGRQYRKSFTISNKGNSDMTDISINVKGSDGLVIANGYDSFYLDKISAGKEKKLYVYFDTAAELSSVNQSLGIDIEYYYDKGGVKTAADKTGTVVMSSEVSSAPVLRVSGEQLTEAILPDSEYDYTLYIKNYGDVTVRELFVDLTGTDGFYFLEGTEAAYIEKIQPGGTAKLKVRFRTFKEISSAKQGITAAINYSYGRTTSLKQSEYSGSVVMIAAQNTSSDGNKGAAPNIIIGKYDIGADQIAAGDVFTLGLDFYNTSSSTNVENIVMTITASGDLSVYGGSSSFYYPTLAAAAAASESIQLRALPTAATGTASVSVSFKYDYISDGNRTTMTADQSIYIPLYQPDKLSLSISKPTYDIYVGNEAYISLSYMNKGRADAANAKAEVVAASQTNNNADDVINDEIYGTAEGIIDDGIAGDYADDGIDYSDGAYDDGFYDTGMDSGYSDPGFTALTTEKVIGNIQAGGNGSVDFVITPTMAGEVNFVIRLTYENSNMNEIVRELPVTLNVIEQEWYEPMYPMTFEADGDIDEGGFPWLIVIIGGCVIAAAAVVVIIIVHKKRKKGKKLSVDDIDWEDELDDDKTKV